MSFRNLPFHRITTTNNVQESEELIEAKLTIDWVVSNGSVYYKKKHRLAKCCWALMRFILCDTREHPFASKDEMRIVSSSMDIRVNREIIAYAAAKIKYAKIYGPHIKYAITDAVRHVVWTVTKARNITPDAIVKLASGQGCC